jgi:hypothetical protein
MNPYTADDSGDNDGDGYTNIEEYLNWIPDNYEMPAIDAFSTIEAENFSSQYGVRIEACDEGGEDVGYIENGDWIKFPNVDFGTNGASEFIVRASSNGSEGTLHIRLDGNSTSATEIGSVHISSTGDWQTYTNFTCDVNQVAGGHDLYLVFEGGSGYLFNLNYFYFTETTLDAITIQENRVGFCGVDGTIDNNNAGFSGDGFANTTNETGKGVDYKVTFGTSEIYSFTFRYASSNDRPANLIIGGSTVVSGFNFPSTGSWTTWNSVSTDVYVTAGTYDIRLEATSSDGLANIDYMMISGDNLSAAACNATDAVIKGATIRTFNNNNIEGKSGIELSVSPSPNTTGELNIKASVNSTEVLVSLFKVSGNLVMKEVFKNGDTNIFNRTMNVSNLEPGVYLLKLQSGKKIQTTKFIIK